MTTTLRDALVQRIDQVDPAHPDVQALVGLGERRLRRRQLAAVLGSATAVLVVIAVMIGGTTLFGPSKSTGPVDKPSPNPSPSPTRIERPHGRYHPPKSTQRLNPRQTVQSYNAQLVAALTSFDDPDVRISLWTTKCLVCPGLGYGRGPRSFNALAVTDDGYRTATYLRAHVTNLDAILSVSRDTFLLSDRNIMGKLLNADGTLRTVRLVDQTRTPDDPQLVYGCGGDDTGPGVGWCVLDVTTATAARLPTTFTMTGRSAGNPALGQQSWGAEGMGAPPYRAWWNDGGIRRTSDLAHPFQVVPSLSQGEDTPTYVRWPLWSHHLDVFQVKDRTSGLTKIGSRPWLPLTRAEIIDPTHPKEVGITVEYARTPNGGLLAWSSKETTRRPGLTIWRAPRLTSGEFETVYAGPPYSHWSLAGYHSEVVGDHGRIYLDRLVSDDDGRTWTEQAGTWR